MPGDPSKATHGSLKERHDQMIRSAYLRDLKTSLDKSSINSFFSALSAYKKTDDYDAMVSVVAALTTERPENFHLLQSKYLAVHFSGCCLCCYIVFFTLIHY